MKRDYLITLLSTQILMLVNLVSFKLVTLFLGEHGFALYNIGRRTISVLYPLMMMGIGISLVRNIAMTSIEEHHKRHQILFNAVIPILFVALFAIATVFFIPSVVATLLLGDGSLELLVLSIFIYVLGLSLCGLLQSFFRGRMQFVKTNLLGLFSGGLIPMSCILLFRTKIEHVYFAAGFTMISVFVVMYLSALDNAKIRGLYDASVLRTHLVYGLPRTPGDISFYMLLMVPSWWATHSYGLEVGGRVAFACTILNLFASAISPISFILLPKASAMFKNGKQAELKKLMIKLIMLSATVSVVGIIIIQLSIGTVIEFCLGKEYMGAVDLIRIVAIGTLPYSLFICLRSIVDAESTKPINSIICMISLGFMLSWDYLMQVLYNDSILLVVGLVISLYIVAILSIIVSLNALKNKPSVCT
ncbi:MAG: hypothetical protein A2075_12820 [Geobacteraceae bacterium GWC2_58_44]|nr:MAG: hypothetical protein A2075_12820 [Geobacteraceae bacterium GWC2_58_44]HBG05619.1 hypothetical protein [Geobacter sp.]